MIGSYVVNSWGYFNFLIVQLIKLYQFYLFFKWYLFMAVL